MTHFVDSNSGYTFVVQPNDSYTKDIIDGGIKDYHMIKWCDQYLYKGGVCIDIGASFGPYSMILSSKCRQVHSFEPHGKLFENLVNGIEANKIENIEVYNIALGSDNGIKGMTKSLTNIFDSTLQPLLTSDKDADIIDDKVEVRTLDSYNINNINFIKVNVVGYELEVLKGAAETLKRNYYPFIFFRYHPSEHLRSKNEDLMSWLREIGYKICQVYGSDNMYLASEHREYKENIELIMASNNHNKLPLLIEQYRQLPVDDLKLHYDDWMLLGHYYKREKMNLNAFKCFQEAHRNSHSPSDKMMALYGCGKVGFNAGYLEKAKKSLNAVILGVGITDDIKGEALISLSKLMSPLPFSSRKVASVKNIEAEFSHSSTAIIPFTPIDSDNTQSSNIKFKSCIRTVNYIINDDGTYTMHNPYGHVCTTNYLAMLDSDLNIVSEYIIKDNSSVNICDGHIKGMEDIRLFGDKYFLAAYPQVNKECIPQICLGEYEDNGSVYKITPLSVTPNIQCEKNWLPFIKPKTNDSNDDDEIYIIYSFDPLKIYSVDSSDGKMTLIQSKRFIKNNISGFRGSAPPIMYKNGWLFTIHQVYYDNPRKYFHRFVWADLEFETLNYSDLFYFQGVDIEYNLSICHSEQGLLVPYSFRDSSSVIGVLPYSDLDRLLNMELSGK